MEENMKIIKMSEVKTTTVSWLWNPYIPLGKLTILQGDPGDGKTMLILYLVALLSKGLPLPEQNTGVQPISIIYQTAEDGLADTIKPRLESAGADCCRVYVIDDSQTPLTVIDKRLKQAIVQQNAKLLVLDPLQAFLGAEVDMHRANEIRPILKRLALTAEQTGCAIVLVGHMNKMSGAKGLYRGLGSIDIPAAARSILLFGKSSDSQDGRILVHLKSSLAPFGESLLFDLDGGLTYEGTSDITAEQLLNGLVTQHPPKKRNVALQELERLLEGGEMPCTQVYEVSYHCAVDDKEVVQGVPFNRNTWNAGDGNGKGNREGIAIEICYSKSGGTRFIQAERNAAWYIAILLRSYNWDISRVTKHQDYNGKYCPHRTLDMGWNRFVLMVEVELAKLKGDISMSQYDELSGRIATLEEFCNKHLQNTLKQMRDGANATQNELTLYKKEQERKSTLPCPDWANESVQRCIDLGIVQGDGGTKPAPDTVRPMDHLTRAEMCVMLCRLMDQG